MIPAENEFNSVRLLRQPRVKPTRATLVFNYFWTGVPLHFVKKLLLGLGGSPSVAVAKITAMDEDVGERHSGPLSLEAVRVADNAHRQASQRRFSVNAVHSHFPANL